MYKNKTGDELLKQDTQETNKRQEVTPPKRGSSLPNYLDRTQSREFG